MRTVKATQTKKVLGAILNLVRYRAPRTLEEANTRLQLIDKIVMEVLSEQPTAPTIVTNVPFSSARSVTAKERWLPDQTRRIQKAKPAPQQIVLRTHKKNRAHS